MVIVVGRGGDGWEVDALAAANSLRRRLVDVTADSRARKGRGLRDRSVTGVVVVVVPVLMMMMTTAGRAATHGRQIFVAVHHESFFGGAINDGSDRRQVVVGRRMGFIGVVVVVVLESRIDRHLATDDGLRRVVITAIRHHEISADGRSTFSSSQRRSGGCGLAGSAFDGADVRQTGGDQLRFAG